jgi:hypothetical protein
MHNLEIDLAFSPADIFYEEKNEITKISNENETQESQTIKKSKKPTNLKGDN